MEENNPSSGGKKIILIGVGLFAFVAFFTFIRPLINRQKDSSESPAPIADEQEKYSFISASELQSQVENIIIFDSRPQDEFSQEHLVNSLSVSLENINQYLEKLDPAKKIVVIGTDSQDISVKGIAQSLKNNGLENFSILSGGMSAWIKAGGKTFRLGNPASLSDQAKISITGPEELKSALDNKEPNLYILDLRSSGKYASEHLPQAKNIPASELESKFKTIPLGKNIVFYANSDLEAFQFGVTLFDLGYPRSSALEGGIEAWKAKGFPMEK